MLYTFGPSGGVGGDYYEALPPVDGGNWWISRVVGRYGNRIDEIQIFWSNGIKEVGSGQFGNPNGGNYGFDFSIRVDKSANYLTEIRGSVGNYNDSVRLFSIQFFTQ